MHVNVLAGSGDQDKRLKKDKPGSWNWDQKLYSIGHQLVSPSLERMGKTAYYFYHTLPFITVLPCLGGSEVTRGTSNLHTL